MLATINRRGLLAAGAALPLFAIGRARAAAPEFEYKLANDSPMTHPNTIRGQEACDRIFKETNGRLKVNQFPNNQLGGDTDMLSQLRSGALEFFLLSGGIYSTFVPVASIYGVGYAFKNYDDVWRAMDGELGRFIARASEKAGIHAYEKLWDNGFRQISSSTHPINTPADLKGFKIRVPVNPLYLSTFEALGASPTSINFSEVYSALQTKIVEGQENPLLNIETAKLYEVQKYISMSRHIWDGYLMLANNRALKALPADIQAVVQRVFDETALVQRADVVKADSELRATLTGQGIVFNDPDSELFREALVKAGFYTRWRDKYGSEAWAALEKYTGKIA